MRGSLSSTIATLRVICLRRRKPEAERKKEGEMWDALVSC
jgi:hypothetical protein